MMVRERLRDALAPTRTRGFRLLLRVVGLLALVIYLAFDTDLVSGSLASLTDARPTWLLAGVTLQVGALFASALRVRLLLRSIGRTIPDHVLALDAAKAVGLGASLAIGAGEIYRVGRLRAEGVDFLAAGLVVAADRAIGTLAILATGLVGLATVGRVVTGIPIPAPVALAVSAAACGLAIAFGSRWVPGAWREALPIGRDRGEIVLLSSVSLVVLGLWIGSIVALARSVGISASPGALAFAASWVTIATLVPVTIGGVGVREAGYAVLLMPYGVDRTDAVALGLIQYGGMLAVSALAWLLAPAVDTAPREAPAGDLTDRSRLR